MATVSLRGVSKTYPSVDTPAVRPLDLEVVDREFLVLVGPSGCGKTTLLRMIAGLEEPTTGHLSIGGRDVTHVPPKDRDIAMVFQNYALYPHMSVFDNMAFGLKLRKTEKGAIKQRVEDAAAMMGLTEVLQRKPKSLSGGQRQRVALGRAIVRHPTVFLFDEPLSNLDATMRVAMRAELSKLHRRLATTMIYVTHDQTEAMTMGDRIAVMRAGVIEQIADPLTLYHRPRTRFVAGFIGSPAMNFIKGTLVGDGTPVFEAGALRVPLGGAVGEAAAKRRGSEVLLGVRPEDVLDGRDPGAARGEPRVPASVEVVEPMGNETFVHASLGDGVTLVSRGGWSAPPAVGERVEVAFRVERLHLFDPGTDAALV